MTDTEETSEISSSAQLGLQGLLNANPLNTESTEPESTNNSAENTNRTMNDLESDSILPDDKDATSRKVITTGRSNDLDDNASTPAIIDSTSDNTRQGPRRSISESALKDHHDTFEQTSTLPIQQDENSTNEEETTTDLQDVDPDREIADVSRRSSSSKSPLNRPQAPTKSPVQLEPSSSDEKPESRATSSSEQSKLIKQGEKLQIPTNDIDTKSNNSPPPSPITKNLITANPILANHSRQASQSSTNKQKSKTNSAASRKSKTPSENSKQQQRQSPYQTEKNKSHTSAASSRTATPTNDNLIKQANVPALQTTTDDETQASRPQSPNVEQIAERNQPSSKSQKQIQEERRANSVESFNRIRLVDDKSLDSVEGTNTEESEQTKSRRIKSKKKDAESNTDLYNSNRNQQQQQQVSESTSRKPSKTNKSMTEKSPSIRRYIRSKGETPTPDTEPETTSPKLRHSSKTTKENIENEQIKTASFNNERQTLSDTEQIVGDKQKKRRRPKRISRTTQTYECVFRRMEYDQHDELRPANDTDKNIQTKKSFLRPRNTSPKKHYPIAISTDELKIEEIFPKQSAQLSRNATRTSVTTQNTSSTTSKLLLLRPTLPIQHAESLNVQRISVHYNIDLTPKENKPTTSTSDPRNNKLQTNNNPKPNEEKNTNLPNIHPLPNKLNGKEKINTNKKDDKTQQQRKPFGNV